MRHWHRDFDIFPRLTHQINAYTQKITNSPTMQTCVAVPYELHVALKAYDGTNSPQSERLTGSWCRSIVGVPPRDLQIQILRQLLPYESHLLHVSE